MQLIPLSQRFIAGKSERTVSARKRHEFLGVSARFADWITRQIDRFEFRENQDFIRIFLKNENKSGRGCPDAEYWLTLEMAKELAMLARTEKGREARRYFIACERRLQEQQIARVQAAQPQRTLPAAAGPAQPSRALRSAIDRKAHAVSLRTYESAKARIELWVRANGARTTRAKRSSSTASRTSPIPPASSRSSAPITPKP
jgi:phage anti-repressor protein